MIARVVPNRSDLPNVLIREILKYDFVKAVVPIEQYVSADTLAVPQEDTEADAEADSPEEEKEGGAGKSKSAPKPGKDKPGKDKPGKDKPSKPESPVEKPTDSDPSDEVDLVVNLPRDVNLIVHSTGGTRELRGAKGQSVSVIGLVVNTNPEVLRPYYIDTLDVSETVSLLAAGHGSERYLWDTAFGPGFLRWSGDLERQLHEMSFQSFVNPDSPTVPQSMWLFTASQQALKNPMFVGKLRQSLITLLNYLEYIVSSRYRWAGFANQWTLEALAYANSEGNPVIDLDVALKEGGATPRKAIKPLPKKVKPTAHLKGKSNPKAKVKKDEYSPAFLQLVEFMKTLDYHNGVGSIITPDPFFTEDPVGMELQERLSKLNSWLVHKMNFIQRITLSSTLHVTGLEPYYDKLYALIAGDHGKEMQQRYTQELTTMESDLREGYQVLVQRAEYVARALDINFHESRYRSVYMRKYGWTKYKEVSSKVAYWWPRVSNRFAQTMQEYVKKHNAKEDQVIQEEIELREAWERLVATGVGAELRTLRNEVYQGYTIRDRWVAWMALRKRLSIDQRSGKNRNDWYRTGDGVPLVCPHVIDLLQLQNEELLTGKASPAAEINAIYNRYQLTDGSEVGGTDSTSYFCRICGEPMRQTEDMDSYVTAEGDVEFSVGDERDPLEIEIRNVVFNLAKSSLEFASPKSQQYWRKMINVVSQSLTPLITLVDRKIRKNRTITDEQIQDRVRLFIHIYVYASLMQIVLDHGDEAYLIAQNVSYVSRPREGKGVSVTRIGNRLPAMLKFTAERVSSEMSEVLRQIPDADSDFVNSALVQAYENIRSTTRGTVLGDDIQTDAYMLPYDPLLRILGIYCKLSGTKPKTMKVSLVRESETGSAVDVTNSDTQPIKSKRKGKKGAVRLAKEKIKSRLERHSKGAELSITVIDSESTYNEQKQDLMKDAKHFVERVEKLDLRELRAEIQHGKLSSEYWEVMIYQALSRTYEFSHEKIGMLRDPVTLEFTKAVLSWVEAQEPIQKAITKIWSSTKLFYCKPNAQWPGYPDLDTKYQPLTLKRYRDYLRCTVGTRLRTEVTARGNSAYTVGKLHNHNFSTYELRWTGGAKDGRKNGEIKLMTVKQVKAEPVPDLVGWIYVRSRCTICKYSEEELLDSDESPSEAMDREQEATNLFNYYEARCPVSDPSPYHDRERQGREKKGKRKELEIDPPCIKCGLTSAMRIDHDAAYYRKYLKIFQQDSAEDRAEETAELNTIMGSKKAKNQETSKKVEALNKPKTPSLLRTTAVNTNDLSKRLEDLMKLGAQNLSRAIQYLGAVELYEYDLVLNGNVKPELDANRGPRLNLYIGTVIRYFVTLQNYKNLAIIPEELKTIISEIPNGTWGKIDGHGRVAKLVPEAGAPYMSWVGTLRVAGMEAEEIAEQQYQYLVALLLGMIKIEGMGPFVRFLVEKLMQTDRLTSKLKEAKEASLDAKQQLFQAQSVNEDKFYEMAHDPRPDPKNDIQNPFSFSHMDYDGHNEKYNR